MADPSKVKVGDVLWETKREQCGNVRGMTRMASRPIFILALPDAEHPHTWLVGWNLPTQHRRFFASDIRKLRLKEYEPKKRREQADGG